MLPTDAKERKALPIWTGVMKYFPDVFPEIARVSVLGNEQHNPGEPLHWARGKSSDFLDSAVRHIFDHGTGQVRDADGAYHLAKAIWRLMAQLQIVIEQEDQHRARIEREAEECARIQHPQTPAEHAASDAYYEARAKLKQQQKEARTSPPLFIDTASPED